MATVNGFALVENDSSFQRPIFKPFYCNRCGRQYKWKASLHCHQRDECGKKPQFQCYLCSYQTKIKSNWIRHQKIHGDDTIYGSNNVFNECNLRRGRPKKHTTTNASTLGFECVCGNKYQLKGTLDRHKRYECGKAPTIACPKCFKLFKHRHHMVSHTKTSLSNQRCDYQQNINYESTMIDDREFICNGCGKIYKWKESLMKHKRIECGKPHEHCNFTTVAEEDLNWTLKKQPRRPHCCFTCGKTYCWKVSLMRHIREECGKPPAHCCEYCGRKFKQKSSYLRHLRSQHYVEDTIHDF
ncbi:hypothetical protein PV327_006781 [Microctonus hyperodae]|uniref:C2H2-type domain-containing protein n=1 Tax=Microctonus hyperodae TaxID=165561 RepID=A0AA39F533_MICHY|nr:hypothetical protein PV327_006781 [Microctonus hyperodae]